MKTTYQNKWIACVSASETNLAEITIIYMCTHTHMHTHTICSDQLGPRSQVETLHRVHIRPACTDCRSAASSRMMAGRSLKDNRGKWQQFQSCVQRFESLFFMFTESDINDTEHHLKFIQSENSSHFRFLFSSPQLLQLFGRMLQRSSVMNSKLRNFWLAISMRGSR